MRKFLALVAALVGAYILSSLLFIVLLFALFAVGTPQSDAGAAIGFAFVMRLCAFLAGAVWLYEWFTDPTRSIHRRKKLDRSA